MMLPQTFSEKLNSLRRDCKLTVYQLAARAGVPQSLISGLSTSNRVIGENNARKIGEALQLSGDELESFIYLAINACSEKVLQDSKRYPAEILNLIATELQSFGITAETINRCVRKPRFNDSTADAA